MSRERDGNGKLPAPGRVSFAGPDEGRSQMRSGKPAPDNIGEAKPGPMPAPRREATAVPSPGEPEAEVSERRAARPAPSRPVLPAVVPETSTKDRDRGLEDARGRSFKVDDFLGVCFERAYNQREDGRSLSLHVAEIRQFEGAVLADVMERQGLIAKRTGVGAEHDRARISLFSAVGRGEKELAAEEVVFGRPLAAFNEAFREELASFRRQIVGVGDERSQRLVAEQLLVQDGTICFTDPQLGAVRTAWALRVPDEDGFKTVGFASSRGLSALGEGLRLITSGVPSESGGFEPEMVVSPAEAGLAELDGQKGSVVRGAVVSALQARGVEFVTAPVTERDLLKGTKLYDQDGARRILAEAFSGALAKVVDGDELRDVLESSEMVGSPELMRRSEAFCAGVLVALYRLDQATATDLEAGKSARWVDPVARLTLAMRATLNSAAEKSELVEAVESKIREWNKGFPNSGDHQGRMMWDLHKAAERSDAQARQRRRGGEDAAAAFDVMGAIGKTFARALERADDRKVDNEEPHLYGSDLALLTNRSERLTAVLKDVRAVAEQLGLGQKDLAKHGCTSEIFDNRLDGEIGRGPESLFSRQFGATHRAMRVLMQGDVQDDPRVHEHPLYEAANKILERDGGLMFAKVGHRSVNAQVAMMADAILMEASGADIERSKMGGEVLTTLQDVARKAVADELDRMSERSDLKPTFVPWYKLIRDRAAYVLQGRDVTSEESLTNACTRLSNPHAKALMERIKGLPIGAFYGGLKEQMRLPGYPIRLGKLAATYDLAQKDIPSGMPDVPNFPPNPASYVRILQLRGGDGKPSGDYIRLKGEPLDTGAMQWTFDDVLRRPKAEINTQAVEERNTRLEVLHKAMALPSGMCLSDLKPGPANPELVRAVSKHFSDVPLRNDRFLSHGYLVVDPRSPAGLMGVQFPAGAYRPMNLRPNSGDLIRVQDGKPQAGFELVPLNATKTGLDPKGRPVLIQFNSQSKLEEEFNRRMEIACRSYGIEEGSPSYQVLEQAKKRLIQHGALFLDPEVLDKPMLVLMPGGQARHKPACTQIMPIKGKEWDPVACQRAFADLTSDQTAYGIHFIASITQG